MRKGSISASRMWEPKENRLYLAIVLTYLAVSFLLGGLECAGIQVQLPLVLRLISGELTLVIPAILYVLLCRPRLKDLSSRWRLPIAVIPLLILMAYCIMPLISVVNLISMVLAGENAVAPMLDTLQQLPMWLSLLCIAVLPGVVEEFIFRGLLYGEYRRRRIWASIFTSAFLFGLMHMNLNQFCYAFVIGILFCLVYEATGSLLAPMLMHMVYNGNSVVLTYLMDHGAKGSTGGTSTEASAQQLQQMLGGNLLSYELLVTGIAMTVLGLIGLAAAGGLYVAVVKLCHREKQVLLLFQRDSWGKRMRLESGERMTEEQTEMGEISEGSRKICGPIFWIGVILSVAVIFLGVILR